MTNREYAATLRSAASALEHGRYATARRKLEAIYRELHISESERGMDVYHCDFACAKCGKATSVGTGCTDGAWVYCSDDCKARH